ncbi:site-2 protease. Metallo peptidase. MEROPS family M50B [Malonomonas rubra DSM 5091]|uniref:Zinc metalloprotease n=1 Tax=Malonomonas rubra DSM 5091 TaxID=1122189 RepID=A0A1M6BQM0_MALRU|nr:RIP metalloprotease RseP [Malonomonas rubra]SHI50874.1 site-2 protease. Metallo peptidase. MEROPS family M50B [Malonomonas rubra DSM 5091]
MTTVIAGILMLGVLVFVHELGHFAVAKWCNVKVLRFSLGFGPKLVSKQWGETEYLICAIPLGGYVQMLGEGSGEHGEEAELTPEERRRSFADQKVSRRLAIVSAGPLMNLILPFLILPISFMSGVQMPTYLEEPAVIGHVIAESEAAKSGFMAGDQVLSVNQRAVESWNQTNKAFVNSAGDLLRFEVERDGKLLTLEIPEENNSLEGMQALGLLPMQQARVGGLADNMPAEKAGLQVGDLILQIGDQKIATWYDLKVVIQQYGGATVPLQLERAGQTISVELTPEQRDGEGDFLIGIAPMQQTEVKRYGFVAAFEEGAKRTWELIELTVVFVQKLFSGSVSAKNIGGPITVVQVAGQAAQTDLAAILSVLAFISIQLGILNLLPIPILDGGHILFNLIELILRRPVSIRVREMAQQVGIAMLLMLMVLAFYNDIVRLLS